MILLLCLALQASTADEFVRRLDDESGAVRDDATKALRAMGDEAVSALRRAHTHDDAEVRARAADLLFHIERTSRLTPSLLSRYPSLLESLRIRDHGGILDFAQRQPGYGHGWEGNFEAYAIGLLEDPDLDLQKLAAEALVRRGERFDAVHRRPIRAAVEAIARWTPIRSEDFDHDFLRRLGKIVLERGSSIDRPLLESARADHRDGERLLQILRAGFGVESAIPALGDALTSGPDWARFLAVEAVYARKIAGARGALLDHLRETGGDYYSWRALGAIADSSSAPAVIEALERSKPDHRMENLLYWLPPIPLPHATPLLLELLRNGPPDRREHAARALARIGATQAFDPVLDALVRAWPMSHTGDALGRLTDGQTVDRLLALIDHPDEARRGAAKHALSWVTDPVAQTAILRRFETEKEPELRMSLFKTVLGQGPEGMEEVLEKVARDPSDPLAPPAAATLLRIRGREAARIAEDLVLRAEAPGLLEPLGLYPSERLLDRAASAEALDYLVRLGTPEARRRVERMVAETTDKPRLKELGAALHRLGGDGLPALTREHPEFWWRGCHDLIDHDLPGVRETLRRQVRAGRVGEDIAHALTLWALPEMVPKIRDLLDEHDRLRSLPDPRGEGPQLCSMTLPARNWGLDALEALGATGDRTLVPLFRQCLQDHDFGFVATAARTLGRWKIADAAAELRQLVRSANPHIRAAAIEGLAGLGEPGTADFLKANLRDNPHAAPYALARLGVDCLPEVATLLEDDGDHGPVVGALDLMANPKVYEKLDAPLPLAASARLEALPDIVQRITGVPSRLSTAAHARLRRADIHRDSSDVRTLRQALVALEKKYGTDWGPFTHLYRDGAIEICTVEEAVSCWRKRLGR